MTETISIPSIGVLGELSNADLMHIKKAIDIYQQAIEKIIRSKIQR